MHKRRIHISNNTRQQDAEEEEARWEVELRRLERACESIGLTASYFFDGDTHGHHVEGEARGELSETRRVLAVGVSSAAVSLKSSPALYRLISIVIRSLRYRKRKNRLEDRDMANL